MQPLIDRYNLNLFISKENMELVDHLQSCNDQLLPLKTQRGKSERKKTNKEQTS